MGSVCTKCGEWDADIGDDLHLCDNCVMVARKSFFKSLKDSKPLSQDSSPCPDCGADIGDYVGPLCMDCAWACKAGTACSEFGMGCPHCAEFRANKMKSVWRRLRVWILECRLARIARCLESLRLLDDRLAARRHRLKLYK